MVTDKEIVDYYDFSMFDYRLYSGSFSDISMHYGLWDATTKRHKEALINENRVLADIVGITPSDTIIDLGCGYGLSAIWLAKNRGCHATGVTLSEKQVDFAKDLAVKRGVSHLTDFLVGDFHKTNFPDGYFSVAFAIESISHSEDKRKALSEIFRILKSGGRFVVADGFFRKDPDTLTEKERIIAKKCFEGVHVPPVSRKDDFEKYLRDAGFKNIVSYDKTSGILPTAKIVHRFGKIFYPLSKILGWLGSRTLQTSHMEAFINQYPAFRDGIGVYGVFYGEKW